MIIGEYQLREKDRFHQRKIIRALSTSFILLLLSAPSNAWLLGDPDDDPMDPKKLRTDVPVTVKSSHLDVIAYVDAERGPTECNLAPYAWPPTLAPNLVPNRVITAENMNEMRNAIKAMYTDLYGVGWSCALQFPPGTPGGTLCETVLPGDIVRRDHINDIRHSFGPTFSPTNNTCDLFPNAGVCSGNIYWTDQGCGISGCVATDQYQTGYDPVNPANVACHVNRCFPSGVCGGGLTCGNGAFEGGEGCDDGNTSDGDGCNAECSCEITYVSMGCGLNGCAAGEMYKVGTTYTVATAQCPSPTGLCYADAAACGAPGCGNGTPDAGEQCDDNNIINGDGCSDTCQCEYTWADESCGGPTDAECLTTEMYQNGTSLSPQCAPVTQCVVSASCDALCGGCTAWSNNACGAYGFCDISEMKQARTCDAPSQAAGCLEWQCLPAASSPECASCGNGAADAGETQDNCCRDMGCPPGPNSICWASSNMCYPPNYCQNGICEPGAGENAGNCADCP